MSAKQDALETLGTILTGAAKRDAIHVAVEPAIAACSLRPGQDVGFWIDGTVGPHENPVGIVDPFLKQFITKGDRFWLFVYPRTITNLRHVWSHPNFSDEQSPEKVNPPLDAKTRESLTWLHDYADSIYVTCEDLLSRAGEYVEHDKYWSEGDKFYNVELEDQFWEHYQRVTGNVVPKHSQNSFFSCSC